MNQYHIWLQLIFNNIGLDFVFTIFTRQKNLASK